MTRNVSDQQEYDKIKAKLWQPPPTLVREQAVALLDDSRNPWSPANETSAFKALQAGLKA